MKCYANKRKPPSQNTLGQNLSCRFMPPFCPQQLSQQEIIIQRIVKPVPQMLIIDKYVVVQAYDVLSCSTRLVSKLDCSFASGEHSKSVLVPKLLRPHDPSIVLGNSGKTLWHFDSHIGDHRHTGNIRSAWDCHFSDVSMHDPLNVILERLLFSRHGERILRVDMSHHPPTSLRFHNSIGPNWSITRWQSSEDIHAEEFVSGISVWTHPTMPSATTLEFWHRWQLVIYLRRLAEQLVWSQLNQN